MRKQGAMQVLQYYNKQQVLTSWNPPGLIVEIGLVPAVQHIVPTSLQPGDPDPVLTQGPADRRLMV